MAPTGRRRDARRRSRMRLVKSVTPAIGLLAMLGAAVAVVVQSPSSDSTASATQPASNVLAVATAEPPTEVNRSAERPPLPDESAADERIKAFKFAATKLAVHADSSDGSPVLASIAAGDPVAVTGKTTGGWTQIMHKDAPRWVKSDGVVDTEPLGTKPCPFGSESGLHPDSVKTLRAVCAKFPQLTNIGTVRGSGEHATGQALDIMVSSDLGNDVAEYLQEHQSELGIEYLIWRQRIWRPATSTSWRPMSDRGSPTANHMDHVHVTTYGSSATR